MTPPLQPRQTCGAMGGEHIGCAVMGDALGKEKNECAASSQISGWLLSQGAGIEFPGTEAGWHNQRTASGIWSGGGRSYFKEA